MVAKKIIFIPFACLVVILLVSFGILIYHDASIPPSPITVTRDRMMTNRAAVMLFYAKRGFFPKSQAEGMSAIADGYGGIPEDCPVLEDGWNRPLIYLSPGRHDGCEFELVSYGVDGQAGGNDDITLCKSPEGHRWISPEP